MLRGLRGIVGGLIIIAVIELWVLFLPPDTYEMVIKENGLVEMSTAIGLLAAACWLFFEGFRHRLSHYFASGTLVFMLGLRELDFHVRFTTMGIFKTRFYISPEVPVTEKIIVSIIVIIMFAALYWYARKYGPNFMQNLRNRDNSAICIAITACLAGITKTLDRCSDEINGFFTTFLHLDSATVVRVSEETLELGIPLFILLAIYNLSFKNKILSR